LGSIFSSPPANDTGKSFARSRAKYGLDPEGKVNLSNPARRVAVASIRISLFNVKEKYPGDASEHPSHQLRMALDIWQMKYHQYFSSSDVPEHPESWCRYQIRGDRGEA